VAQIPSGEMIEVPDSAPFALSGGCSSEPHLRSTPQGTQQGVPWTPATYTPSSTCLLGPRYWRQRPIIADRYALWQARGRSGSGWFPIRMSQSGVTSGQPTIRERSWFVDTWAFNTTNLLRSAQPLRSSRLQGHGCRHIDGMGVLRQIDVSGLHERPGEASPNPVWTIKTSGGFADHFVRNG
jgi:hypothetical protein